ncbi:MAG: hypothetical protein B0D92_08770 [Spirochaeta sp. LUC14_002_19_P3]|nr:MAG: hypothetical protein B0D92_08770 [Spirochaeta sp. LUC14_002_19_P3]
MSFFILTVAPLWYLLIVSLYKPPSSGWKGIFLPWFGGLFAGMVVLLITLGLLTRNPFGMNFAQLYSWAWIRGVGWPMIPGTLGIVLILRSNSASHSRIRTAAGWFSGMATVYLIWTALTAERGFELYYFFLLPLIWLAVIGYSSVLVHLCLKLFSSERYVALAAALLMPSVLTLVPVLYFGGGRIVAWIVGLLLALCAVVPVFLNSRGRLN